MSTPVSPPDTPRVLLFGHPGSGKSALIGALLRASELQGHELHGEVVAPSDAPPVRAAGERNPAPTSHELHSFTLKLKPPRQRDRTDWEPLRVTLDDCDGRAARALIEDPEPVTRRAPDGPLARAVVETDAIMLLVDASSTPPELEAAFGQFERFLTVVEEAKADARTVGGFPVFLVLTQCDRLALAGDTQRVWEARAKDRVEAAWKAFDEFLRQAGPDEEAPFPFLAFGSVDLSVHAVAIRRPQLVDQPRPGPEPHGVAELFRACFASAKLHHERVGRSERRLWWTTRLALGAFAALVVFFGLVALFPPEVSGPTLAEKVDEFRLAEKPASARLAEPEAERNRLLLNRFAADVDFPGLSDDRRAFVESRLKEIDDYKAYRARLANATSPASARSLPDLSRAREALQTDLALPGEYSWGETDAAQLRDKWLRDCDAIEQAEQRFVAAYREFDRTGTALLLKRNFDEGWLSEIDALHDKASQPLFPPDAALPGSRALGQPRGEAVTYRVPAEFDEVYQARRYWELTRDRVSNLRDLADALGLTTAPKRPEAVLALPEPGAADSAALARERWATLLRTYSRQTDGYPEWAADNFPDPVRGELLAGLRKSFEAGVRHVHRLLTVRDTVPGWLALGASLSEEQFRAWGQLLHLLARLQDPNASDPLAELSGFLRDIDKKTFDLDLRRFELTIPRDLTLEPVKPSGPLVVTVTHADQKSESVKLAVGEWVDRGTANGYPLTAEGNPKLGYRAGDLLRAELPVAVGKREAKLVWEVGPTQTFQFDRLSREPRLTKPTPGTEPAPGVKLTLTAGSLPALPVLLPAPGK
ncbi:MAG: GTPase domain-containing protein [Gemmataceae bacterium]|nr:GTPase domain-containing protein [Gemmataceae bacterium]